MHTQDHDSSQEWTNLLAPLDGLILAVETVPDPVFAGKVVGPGIAIDPTSDTLKAPCAGKVVQLHRAHHALTLEHASGAQILLHIGIDTVQLAGQGFFPQVKAGDQVQPGQALIRFDADLVASKAKSLVTLMIVTDSSEDRLQFPFADLADSVPAVAGADVLLQVKNAKNAQAKSETLQPQGPRLQSSPLIAIKNLPTGLHARPAAQLAALAKTFSATLSLSKGQRTGNAKSVVSIMALEISLNDQIQIHGEGTDAANAVTALQTFIENLREQAPEPTPSLPKVARSNDSSILSGIGVSPGMAIGRIHQIKDETFSFPELASTSPETEEAQLQKAIASAAAELTKLMKQVQTKTDAAIFSAHLELLEDPDILTEALRLIAQHKSAAFAWNQAINTNAERIANLNNELLANRANDLRDVGKRVLRNVLGLKTEASKLEAGSILIAESLTPSETVQLDRSKVLGFCTTTGGATSHVAILARSLGIPAIAGIDEKVLSLANGLEVVLDGEKGELRLKPSADDRSRAEKIQSEFNARKQAALKLAHEPALTLDRRLIEVGANIGSVADAKQAVEMGADGVGLLRSEFLFLERESAPSEEEQLKVYQEIADILGERAFVIRTLDVGGDKPLKYLPLTPEENPFLGVRGIRVGFQYPEILRTQLRAILRVRSKGKLCVMFPMIASIEEFREAKAMLVAERTRLGTKAAPQLEIGIMVEVPSAALSADELAREADFFSVGTNDLTQYTLAMDRGHKGLARQVDALHPAVLKLIQLAAEAAHRHGKWIGVCGGLASDLKAVEALIGLGIDELSVSVPSIPLVKSAVRLTSRLEAERLASQIVKAENAQAVRELISETKNTNPRTPNKGS